MIDSAKCDKDKDKDKDPEQDNQEKIDQIPKKQPVIFNMQFPTREYFYATRGWGLTDEQAQAVYPKYPKDRQRSK